MGPKGRYIPYNYCFYGSWSFGSNKTGAKELVQFLQERPQVEQRCTASEGYDLPPLLNWFTGNIGVHHVHHLSAKVPGYRLQEVLRDYPELRGIGRVTLLDSLRCVKLALWDEQRRKLISFAQLRRSQP